MTRSASTEPSPSSIRAVAASTAPLAQILSTTVDLMRWTPNGVQLLDKLVKQCDDWGKVARKLNAHVQTGLVYEMFCIRDILYDLF